MTRCVLFVAEDSNLLETLRTTLCPLQQEWELHFAGGGREALDRLAEDEFGVVVVDANLKKPNTDLLLTEIRRRHPLVVRIVLGGDGDRLRLLKFVSLAHRVLMRPCQPDELRAAIRRATSLQELLASPSLAAVVGRLGNVPSLPALYTRIVDELVRPDYSIEAVGELVGQDVGMAAKLIQMANSALIGLRWPIATPAQAVRILGAEWTKSLALGAGIFSRYDPTALRPFSIEALWEHSRRVASLAGRISTSVHASDKTIRDSTLAGLFHDIGRLTLASQLPGPYREVLSRMAIKGLSPSESEKEVLGATHAEVGAYLLGLWGLPDPLVEAVAWHHTPSMCPGGSFTPLTAVHIADSLCHPEEGDLDRVYIMRLGLEGHIKEWSELATIQEPVESLR